MISSSEKQLELAAALWGRDVGALEQLSSDADINSPTPDGKYPLEIAIKMGPLQVIDTLLQLGADPNQGSNTISPLMVLLQNKPLTWDSTGEFRWQAINRLIDCGASLEERDKFDNTAHEYAWESGLGIALTRLLLARGLQPYLPSAEVRLIGAVLLGHLVQVDTLLRLEVSPDVRMSTDPDGRTALMVAAGRGDLEMTHLLLSYKSDVTLRTQSNIRQRYLFDNHEVPLKNERTALFHAVDRGKPAIVKRILAALPHKHTRPAEECPLAQARLLGRDDLVDILSEGGYLGKFELKRSKPAQITSIFSHRF